MTLVFARCVARAWPSACALSLLLSTLALTLLAGTPATAQVPDEVTALEWCPGTADCLVWSSVPGASGYTLYRGDLAGVRGLLTDQADPCVAGAFATPTSGATLVDPAPAGGHWYLAAATNAAGEGPAGSGSDGPRIVVAAAGCGGGGARLVLNEVDYDQAGADTAEFVEIYNAGDATADLTGVALVFVNGSSSAEYARVDLSAVGSLSAGDWLVVGAQAVLGGLPADVAGLPLSASIQNGAPDGIALVDTIGGTVLDALSYEGEIRDAAFDGIAGTFDLVEGQPLASADTGDGALARSPDGRDTDDAASDWVTAPAPTPGAANPAG